MRRHSKAKSHTIRQPRRKKTTPMDPAKRRRLILVSSIVVASLAGLSGATLGMVGLDRYVDQIACRRTTPQLVLTDMPNEIADLAQAEVEQSVIPLLRENWTDPTLPRRMAESLAAVGWVGRVRFVRRTGDGRFGVSCRYRVPVARIRQGGSFILVDAEGIRLPGTYWQAAEWMLIEGVEQPAPLAGEVWKGSDLQVGLAMVQLLRGEPFLDQIRSIRVENSGGRKDRWRSHVEIATDEPNGRIRWGSPPGAEIEENSAAEKLALLRENYRRTSRIDANYLVIDVSTFPDRFTVPG